MKTERRDTKEPQIETRMLQHVVELRASKEGKKSRLIEGVAARVNAMSQVLGGWFREIIEPGAFEKADMSDVVALKNHNMDLILARTLSKTLTLTIDNRGNLRYSFEAPDTTTGNDLLAEIKRGDIQHSSFSFIVDKYKWETGPDGNEVRRIISFKRIVDVSPVVSAAYLQTEVNARNMDVIKRSLEEYRKTLKSNSHAARNLLELELKIKKNRFKF